MSSVTITQADGGTITLALSPVPAAGLYATLQLAGGTMTGPLGLAADPTSAMQATTKQYVDAGDTTNARAAAAAAATATAALPLAGGTLTGRLLASPSGTSVDSPDNVPTLDFLGETINFRRSIYTGNPSYSGVRAFVDLYANTYSSLGYGFATVPALQGIATSHAGSNAGVGAVDGTLYSYGTTSGYLAPDVAVTATVVQALGGTNATWSFAGQNQDNTGLANHPFQYGFESDLLNNGPDSAASLYNPTLANRYGGLLANKTNPVNNYLAATAVPNGQLVAITPAGGGAATVFVAQNAGTTGGSLLTGAFTNGSAEISAANSFAAGQTVILTGTPPAPFVAKQIYYVQSVGLSGAGFQLGNTPGASGIAVTGTTTTSAISTVPAFNFTYGSTVTDGTVTWLTGTTYANVVGTGLIISSSSANSSHNTGLAVNGYVNNAAIDLSFAVMNSAVNAGAAAIRIGQNAPIDFSGNHTLAGQSQHTMFYSTYINALAYQVAGSTVFTIADTGQVTATGALAAGGLTVNGSAVVVGANLLGVASGYSTSGLTIGRNLSGFNEIDLITASGGVAFYAGSGGTISTPYLTASPAGMTLAGPLTLPANPTLALQAATKGYVDAAESTKVPLSALPSGSGLLFINGGTITKATAGANISINAGGTITASPVVGSPVTLPAGTAATIGAAPGVTKIGGGSGTTIFTLPSMAAVAAAGGNGWPYTIKDNGVAGTSTQTIAAPTGTTIDGAASIALTVNYQAVTLAPDVANNLWSRI